MKEEIEYIYNIPKFTKKAELSNTKEMLRRIGFDESKYKIIHVAGTNGKGSVCSYIANTLRLAGRKTGLFVSPHLIRINERISINGKDISDKKFEESFARVKEISMHMAKEGFVHPSFFEFLFGLGMDAFMHEDVEYIVLETGLGGRLDATNVISKPILNVITSIGLDHTDILGDTLEKIAGEKAGIMKAGTPVVFSDKIKSVTDVFLDNAGEKNALPVVLHTADISEVVNNHKTIDFCLSNKYYDKVTFSVNSLALYQVENAALAAVAMKQIEGLDEGTIKAGIEATRWMGRMEQIRPNLIVDGGHNDDGISGFISSVSEDNCKSFRVLIFSAVKDKHYQGMIKKLCESRLFDHIVTGVLSDKRGLSKEHIVETFEKYHEQKVTFCDNINEAYITAKKLAGDEGLIYVVGSLYLVGEFLPLVEKETK